MKTMFFSVPGVAVLGVLVLAPGCDDQGFLGSTLPLPSGTGGESSTSGTGGSFRRGTGGSVAGTGGYGGYAGEGGDSGEGGYGGSGGVGGSGGSGGEGGYAGSGGSGGYAGEGGDSGEGGYGGSGGVGGYGGSGGEGGYGGYAGYGGIATCPRPGSANTPTTIDGFRAAVTRKWVSCIDTPVGGEQGDALGIESAGIEIKADGRYWHLMRDATGILEGVPGVDSEGAITYGFTDFGAVQTTFRSDLNQILIAAPVVTVSPTMLIIKTANANHRYVPADGP